MLMTERYLYVVFCCHLALEKMLKAHMTAVTESFAPRTHDLIYLIKNARLVLPPPLLDFISKINNASIPTRYPEDLSRTLKNYSVSVARDYLRQTEEAMIWLKQHPNLQE